MSAKWKYNIIVHTIEELVNRSQGEAHETWLTNHEISDYAFKAANCSTMADKDKNTLFLFLNDCTVIDYINERRMVAVYKMICKSTNWTKSIQDRAIGMVGLSDYQALCKKFKKYFSISPMKAYENKEKAIFYDIKDWEAISMEGKGTFDSFKEEHINKDKFGVSRDKFMIAHKASNLQSFYKLNDYESEIAYKLSTEIEHPLEETFEYVYNYVWRFIDDDAPERDQRLEQDLLNPFVIHMYFEYDMTFNEILKVLSRVEKNGLPCDYKDCDRLYLLGYKEYSDSFLSRVKTYYKIYQSEYKKNESVSYDSLYKFYIENRDISDPDEVFYKFVSDYYSDCYGKQSMEEVLVSARNWGKYKDWTVDKIPDLEEFYITEISEDKDEFHGDLDDIDYEPDFEDDHMKEDAYMDHDFFEQLLSEALDEEELERNAVELTLDDLDLDCDQLDENNNKFKKKGRIKKLIGYNSLDVAEFIAFNNPSK